MQRQFKHGINEMVQTGSSGISEKLIPHEIVKMQYKHLHITPF